MGWERENLAEAVGYWLNKKANILDMPQFVVTLKQKTSKSYESSVYAMISNQKWSEYLNWIERGIKSGLQNKIIHLFLTKQVQMSLLFNHILW